MQLKEVIEKLNSLETSTTTNTLKVGRIVFDYLKTIDAKKQRTVINELKKANELKLSPQFVYDCYRMLNKFPEMADPNFKVLENLSITHYFELSRYKLNPNVVYIILAESSSNGESVSQMKERIKLAKSELTKPEETEKKEILAKIYPILRKKPVSELRGLLEILESDFKE